MTTPAVTHKGFRVRLRGVTRAYDDGATRHRVLTGIDLDVAPGEMLALLGPSGSGKSTLLNIIAGLDAPDSGTVEVSGRELGGMSERARTLLRRRDIGFVFQFFNLIPTLTVMENVLLPLELTGQKEPEAARALLERVGLADRARAAYRDRAGAGASARAAPGG
jgi:putative ABC transport system ATP-binding protein